MKFAGHRTLLGNCAWPCLQTGLFRPASRPDGAQTESAPVPLTSCSFFRRKMELRITERGRALVRSAAFAALVNNFIREWTGPKEMAFDHIVRIIALSMCEVDVKTGPALDSPELLNFVSEHLYELKDVGR